MGGLLTLIVYLIVIGILVALAIWIIDTIPVPDPPRRWLRIAIIAIAAILIIMVLLELVGGGVGLPRFR